MAHDSLNNLSSDPSYQGWEEMLMQGHRVIDHAFSTHPNYLNNVPDRNLKEHINYQQGKEALYKHSYDQALESFGKVLEVNPYNPDVY